MKYKNAHVLLIEDDLRLASFIISYLQTNGLLVTHFSRTEHMDLEAQLLNIDVVVCDIMLPGTTGFKLLEQVRINYDGPFIFLSALSKDEHQLRGFELGADDYIIKPIKPELLLARINAALQRSHIPRVDKSQEDMHLGKLILNKATRRVVLIDETVRLSRYEFDVLWLLALNKNKALSRDYLYINLTGKPHDGLDRKIDGRISRLRKKINSKVDLGCKINTLWGQGYMLAVEKVDA
ncbi:DNA-binding response OmpR family regulator [Pseudoalteromonas sp. MBR-15]|jgi:DNA-binding response OmpR family regulator|uniref:response regulator transcription factor n=1 Tax=Pseudoalteromonas lipolytica TaxID=570156 RepID=UPI003B9E95A9